MNSHTDLVETPAKAGLSVLMATHNGADTIGRALAAMSQLDAPEEGWELVIVDNASTDATCSLIQSWQDKLPVKYLFEPQLGKANALNSGLAQVEGDIIIMTDDDVLPDRNWLTEWSRVARSWPALSVFGGAIVPEFGNHPPRWVLSRASLTMLYGQTPDRPEGPIEPVDVAGANLAIRKTVYAAGLRFDPGFLVGKYGLMGEDSDFVRRAFAKGCGIGYAPGARLRHIIQKEQTSWRWMQRRFFRHGRFLFLQEANKHGTVAKEMPAFPRWRARRAALATLAALFATLTLNWDRMFEQSRIVAYDLGAMRQAMLLRQNRMS